MSTPTKGTGEERELYKSTTEGEETFFDFSYYPTAITKETKHLYVGYGSL